MRKALFSAAVMAFVLGPAAQAQQAESDEMAPPVLEWTCADVLGHYADARAKEGVSAEELEQARVFAMEITLWINGYLTGKHGLDLEQQPFGADGLRRTIALVADTCEAAPDARFLDVLKKL